MAATPIAETIRRETETLIGRLVMQNTTLTAQLNHLSAALEAAAKELDTTKQALADAQAARAGSATEG